MKNTPVAGSNMLQVALSPDVYRALLALSQDLARQPDTDAAPLMKKALGQLRQPVPAPATLDDAIVAMNDVVSRVIDAGEEMLRAPHDPDRQEALRRQLDDAGESMNALFEARPETGEQPTPLQSPTNAPRLGLR